jgi:uncharacterized membrane protein YfcA
MTLGAIILANLIMAIGASVQTVAGFGMSLIALPLLLGLDASLAPGPILFSQFLLVLCLSSLDPRAADRGTLLVAGAAAAAGTVAGLYLLSAVSAPQFVLLTACVLVGVSAMTLLRVDIGLSMTNVFVAGFLCGFCGTTTSVSGPPLVAVMSGSRRPAEIRATLALFLLFSTVLSLAGLAAVGKFSFGQLLLSLWISPGVFLGAFCARRFSAQIDSVVRPRMLFAIASSGATLIFVGKALIKSL